MKILSLIIAVITVGFSVNTFAIEEGKCSVTIKNRPHKGQEDDVKTLLAENVKSQCGNILGCRVPGQSYSVNFNVLDAALQYSFDNMTRQQCDEQAIKECRYKKDDKSAIKERLTKAVFIGKALSAYICVPGGLTAVFTPMYAEKENKFSAQPSSQPASVKKSANKTIN